MKDLIDSQEIAALKAEQHQLANLVIQKGEASLDFLKLRTITGLDVAYSGSTGVASAVTLEMDTHKIVEMKTILTEVNFPYIPTLLSYRELPSLLKVLESLKYPSDIFLIDGHGIAHPRGLGLASHFGLKVGRPTIGVAKKGLVGKPAFWPQPGEWAKIYYQEKTIGAIFRPKTMGKPIYISVGHLISLLEAIEVVKKVIVPEQRIPEPLRLADQLTKEKKRELEQKRDL